MKSIKIILIDDQNIVIKAIREFLKKEKEIQIVAETNNFTEAMEKIRELGPDLVVSDVSMPDTDGFATARLILEKHAQVKVLLLSSLHQDAYLNRARDLGVSGYILKDDITDQLVEAIHLIHEGKKYFKGIITP